MLKNKYQIQSKQEQNHSYFFYFVHFQRKLIPYFNIYKDPIIDCNLNTMGMCACYTEKKKPQQTSTKNITNEQPKTTQPVKAKTESTNIIPQSQNSQILDTKYANPFGLRDNPQNKFFKITRSFGVIKVERVSQQFNDGNMYTFFKNGEIPKSQIINFKLKLRAKDRIFNIGIGTKATFGDKAPVETINLQAKELWVDNRKCFIDNQMYPIPQSNDFGSVQLKINTKQWSLSWYISDHHIVTKPIQSKMREKRFYLTITLYHNGDYAEIFVQ